MGDRYVQEARAGGNASVREGRAQGEGSHKSRCLKLVNCTIVFSRCETCLFCFSQKKKKKWSQQPCWRLLRPPRPSCRASGRVPYSPFQQKAGPQELGSQFRGFLPAL